MSKTKILYVSHSAEIAGGEMCLLTLIKYLNKDLFEPVVVLPWEGPLRAEIEKLGVRVHISRVDWWIRSERDFGNMGLNISSCTEGILRVIDLEKPDIVQTNTSVVLAGALAARARQIPHVWHVHEILNGHPNLSALIPLPMVYWMMNSLSERVVAVSDALKGNLSSIIDSENLVTIHNGVDSERLQSGDRSSLREELGLPTDATVAVTIGSLIKEKGHDDLLGAAFLARAEGAKVHYLIVGSGTPEVTKSLKQQIDEFELQDYVHLLGFRDDIGRILDAVDFLILPSLTESFSLVAAEAMGAAKPVIATDCGGPSEIIVDGESGFIVPVNDPRSLSKKILELAADATLRREMGAKAFRRFEEKFRAEHYSAGFEGLYREVAAAGVSRRLSERERELVHSLTDVYQNIHARERVPIQSPRPRALRAMLSPRRWAARIAREFTAPKTRKPIFALPQMLNPSQVAVRYIVDPD